MTSPRAQQQTIARHALDGRFGCAHLFGLRLREWPVTGVNDAQPYRPRLMYETTSPSPGENDPLDGGQVWSSANAKPDCSATGVGNTQPRWRGIALTRKGRSETISWQGPLDNEPSGYPTDYSNETDNDNQKADRRQKQPAQKPYHSIR